MYTKNGKSTWVSTRAIGGFWITIKRRRPFKSRPIQHYYWVVSKTRNPSIVKFKKLEYEMTLTAAKATAEGVILEAEMVNSLE